jgi:hypothetical protein
VAEQASKAGVCSALLCWSASYPLFLDLGYIEIRFLAVDSNQSCYLQKKSMAISYNFGAKLLKGLQ